MERARQQQMEGIQPQERSQPSDYCPRNNIIDMEVVADSAAKTFTATAVSCSRSFRSPSPFTHSHSTSWASGAVVLLLAPPFIGWRLVVVVVVATNLPQTNSDGHSTEFNAPVLWVAQGLREWPLRFGCCCHKVPRVCNGHPCSVGRSVVVANRSGWIILTRLVKWQIMIGAVPSCLLLVMMVGWVIDREFYYVFASFF